MSDQQDIQNHDQALARFEAHMPLLERVIAQVLTGSNGSVRDLVYLGAAVLLRCAAEYTEGSGLTFKEYAEVTITSELLHPRAVAATRRPLTPQ